MSKRIWWSPRCRVCGSLKVRSTETGRWRCPGVAEHKTGRAAERQDAEIWRGILKTN